MFMEFQDTVGKVLLLFLAGCLVVSGSVPLSSSTPGFHSTSGVYGEDVAKNALGWGQVHFWRAGCFGIEAAKRRRIGEGCVEAGKRGRWGARFMHEGHE